MLGQLKTVAGAPHGSVLSYLIDMARLEASDLIGAAGELDHNGDAAV